MLKVVEGIVEICSRIGGVGVRGMVAQDETQNTTHPEGFVQRT